MRAVFIVIAVDPSDQQRETVQERERGGELSSLPLICIWSVTNFGRLHVLWSLCQSQSSILRSFTLSAFAFNVPHPLPACPLHARSCDALSARKCRQHILFLLALRFYLNISTFCGSLIMIPVDIVNISYASTFLALKWLSRGSGEGGREGQSSAC